MDLAIAGVVMGVNTTVMVAVGSWMFLQMQPLRNDARQQHQDLLVLLQGLTHDEEGSAVMDYLAQAGPCIHLTQEGGRP